MIKSVSRRLTGFFIKTSVISEEDRENYNFSFEIMLFDLLSFFTVLLLAVVFHRFIETLIYLLVFASLRFNSGGFHAKTHMGCYLTLVLSYVSFVVLMALTPWKFFEVLSIILCLFSVTTIFALAPVEHVNRKLTPGEIKICKRKCKFVSLLLLAAVIGMMMLRSAQLNVYILSGCYGMLSIALSLIAARILRNH